MSYRNTILQSWPHVSRLWLSGALTAALIAFSGCSSKPLIQPTPLEIKAPPAAVLPLPDAVHLEAVKWQVFDSTGGPMFALPARGYEALARNMAELTRWMVEARYQLDFYRLNRQPPPEPAMVPAAK